LRVLQDQEVRAVGDTISYKTNCRIIAATNRKPEDAIKDGKLREDLYYRISAISVHRPPPTCPSPMSRSARVWVKSATTPASPCSKASSATPSSRPSRKPAATSSK